MDQPYRRRPPSGWRELRRWDRPASECPMLCAHVWIEMRTGRCLFVVTSDLGQFWRIPSAHPNVFEMSPEWEEALVAKWVRKAVERQRSAAEAKSVEGAEWEASHPALWEYMSLEEGEEGKERITSMLCVFSEKGVVKVCLQDRQEALSLWASGQSLVEALDALEAVLQAGTGDWRAARGNGSNGGHRKR